jgi:hypothetical protein
MGNRARQRAVRKLYSQHRTEWDFGWHEPDPLWRAQLRELYPVEFVAAHHRNDVPPRMMNDHARRVMIYNRRLAA